MQTRTIRVHGAPFHSAEIPVGGFKHLLGPLFATAVSAGVDLRLKNVPRLAETDILLSILNAIGTPAARTEDGVLVRGTGVDTPRLPAELTAEIHGGIYLIPALLARLGTVTFDSFGGCPLGIEKGGLRPLHHILAVLERFGATFQERGSMIEGRADGLRPATIDIHDWSESPHSPQGPLLSGATKTAIIAALAARGGTTVIRNPYRKPDVTEMLAFARAAGWAVEDVDGEFRIGAGPENRGRVVEHTLMPDLPEIMTFIACSVHMRTPLTLTHVDVDSAKAGLAAELRVLADTGIGLSWGESTLDVTPPPSQAPVDLEITPDGVYSDHAPFFVLMGCSASGETVIKERVWRHRFSYAQEMVKLGADINIVGTRLEVKPKPLAGNDIDLHATDLRAAATLTLAALGADGPVRITGVHHLARGYENFVGKLRSMGAHIEEER